MAYQSPVVSKPPKTKKHQVLLVASGDLRLSANQKCWPAQKEMEDALSRAVADAGYELALRNSGLDAFRMFLLAQDQLDQKAAQFCQVGVDALQAFGEDRADIPLRSAKGCYRPFQPFDESPMML